MPASLPSETLSHYSPFTGLVYIFNLIVGTGALTLPAAFHDAGWMLSSVIIILLAFMSFLTATFVIESMACANAIVIHRKTQRLKSRISTTMHESRPPSFSESLDHDDNEVTANTSSDSGRATPSNFHYVNNSNDENEPLLSDTDRLGELEVRHLPDTTSAQGRDSNEREQDRYYTISEIFEMGKMASLFFNKTGRILFYLCLTIYLYGKDS